MSTPLTVHGVDISHHQNEPIDWDAFLRTACEWMYHKVTEGASFKDRNYVRRRKEARDHGFPFGPYHFARASIGDARAEARFALDVADVNPEIDLRLALDLETKEGMSDGAIVDWADSFCAEVQLQAGFVPVVYTPFTLSRELENKAIFWVPRYNNTNTPPARPYDIWQFSNGVFGNPNRIAGLGHVDLNFSKVPLSALLIKPPPPRDPGRGRRVEEADDALEAAKGRGERKRLIKEARETLSQIDPVNPPKK